MLKKLFAVIIVVSLIVIPMKPIFAQDTDVSYKEMAKQLAEVIVTHYGASGIQYAIMDNGVITLSDSAGSADVATNEPITEDTMFGIGSVSKMVVTAATMMLADDGLVDIDAPLTTYIEDFAMADERYKQITPRMLMNHTSGLYGTHYANTTLFDDNDTSSHDELLDRMKHERLKSDPGEYAVYCNDGFQLLELLVERVTGISYSEFLNQRISAPLGLTHTKTPLDAFDREQLAKTYYPMMDYALPTENTNVLGAGGLYSTAEELTRFAEVLIGEHEDILSEQSARAMQHPEYRNGIWVPDEKNTFNYGLGWDAVSLSPFSDYGITALNKGGDTNMYHATLTTIPEYKITIAALSSGGSSLYNTIFASNVLLAYLEEQGKIKSIQPDVTFNPPVKAEMPAELLNYAGYYGTVGGTTTIQIVDGMIDLAPLLGGIIPPQQYVYTGDGQFTSNDGSAIISFEEQTNGLTYLKLRVYLTFPGVGQLLLVTYEHQKLDANPLDASTKAAWEARSGKNYYAVDEKINSSSFLALPLMTKHIDVDIEQGYANGTRIVDENTSVNAVEIPVMNGRDAFDFTFHRAGTKEYLVIDGEAYVSEDTVKPIYGGHASTCTIQADGHAVWFKIDEQSANKTMAVDLPEGGGFIVYDTDGMIINFSAASQDNTAVLPAGGLIVFGGDAGDVFKIRMVK